MLSGAPEDEMFKKRKKFALGVIEGVTYLHSQRVVHRDIKPANILCFGTEPVAKICDFGFSKVWFSAFVEIGNSRIILHYMGWF